VRFDEALLKALADLGAPPPVLGFGISKPDHVRRALAAGAAGIISGSAIVRLVAGNPDPAEAVRAFAAEMKAATRA
jgi:tryptophan synthase alpha chain